MALMRSGNPVLKAETFAKYRDAMIEARAAAMTVQGTVTKSLLMLLVVILAGSLTWSMVGRGSPMVGPLLIGGLIAGLILAVVTSFKPTWAAVTAPLYAAAEGLVLGAISSLFEHLYSGIVLQAVGLTAGAFLVMLVAYKMRIIRATARFRAVMVSAIGAIFLVYLVSWILRLFGSTMPYIHDSGLIGIGFSLVVVVVASLSLILDFDLIEQGAAMGAPKSLEWYGAFAVMVTLIWLYLEMLILLAKLQRR